MLFAFLKGEIHIAIDTLQLSFEDSPAVQFHSHRIPSNFGDKGLRAFILSLCDVAVLHGVGIAMLWGRMVDDSGAGSGVGKLQCLSRALP